MVFARLRLSPGFSANPGTPRRPGSFSEMVHEPPREHCHSNSYIQEACPQEMRPISTEASQKLTQLTSEFQR